MFDCHAQRRPTQNVNISTPRFSSKIVVSYSLTIAIPCYNRCFIRRVAFKPFFPVGESHSTKWPPKSLADLKSFVF